MYVCGKCEGSDLSLDIPIVIGMGLWYLHGGILGDFTAPDVASPFSGVISAEGGWTTPGHS